MRLVLVLSAVLIASGCGGCDDVAEKDFVENATTADMTTDGSRSDDGGTRGDGTDDQGRDAGRSGMGRLDLLIVLDNSGSACDEQTRLRSGFRSLLGPLTDAEVDVQIALTTTQMNPDFALEPVAVPGHIQSTPQPVPGFDRSCHQRGGDFSPIREVLAAALACSTVDAANYDWSDADIECALYGDPANCSIAGVCGGGDRCEPEDLYPPPDSYEALPKVMVVEDYRDAAGKLDFVRMERDFACMSLVGTRGYGIEKGLSAAVLATSPGLVGGTVEAPTDVTAANHGLLRDEADFALVFITDENDCSDDGRLNEQTVCGGDVCEFANHPEAVDSFLLPVAGLKTDLMANLQTAKGVSFNERRVWLGGIHGAWARYDGEVPPSLDCGSIDYEGPQPACSNSLGRAFSGDRYDRFLGEFPADHVFPRRGADGHLPGLICDEDLDAHLRGLGGALAAGAR